MEIWIITQIHDLRSVEHFQDVDSVTSDGRYLWVDSLDPLGVAKIPLKFVREIVGTDPALVN